MAVLVSDTSVLIDLERTGLLAEMFLLPFEFAVPDLLYAKELQGDLGDRLQGWGLRIEALTSTEVASATLVRRQHASLSVPDAFAFALAQARQWALLTGDGSLRGLAQRERMEMHGVLWLIEQLDNGRHAAPADLHAGLTALNNHPRCRLPAREVQRVLASLAR